MLPTNFNDRLNQMMGVKMEEIAQETQEAFSRDSAESASRGLIHSSYTLGLYQQRRVQQIDKRVKAVLECQKRLISAVRLPFSETLASDLKTQSEEWVTPEWCEQSVQSDPDLGLMKDYKTGFREETLQARNSALKKASIEIDLLVDELRVLPHFYGHLVKAHNEPGGVSWHRGEGFQQSTSVKRWRCSNPPV